MLLDTLKVLIVDDDYIARTHIKTLINWNKEGFDICGEAANGQVAIEEIDKHIPDIVITDMNMPVFDGASLIKYLDKNCPNVKAIAISGYDAFDYVRKSMKCGAVDYLLKHRLDSETLIEVLNSARSEILEERCKKTNTDTAKRQLVESREVLRQHFIKQLALGGIFTKNHIIAKIKELDMKLYIQNLILVVSEIDDFYLIQERFSGGEANKIVSSMLNICMEILKDFDGADVAHIRDGRFVFVFSYVKMRGESYMYNQTLTAIERIRVSINRYLNITSCFCMSRVFSNILETSQIFNIDHDYTEPTKKAMLFIHRNYASNISLSDAADHLGLNPSYLSRVFKVDCGFGFVEYLNKVRIEHAKWLIEKGDNKLKDIVSEVGFNNYTYFFKIFRRINNMTPLEYRGKCNAGQG